MFMFKGPQPAAGDASGSCASSGAKTPAMAGEVPMVPAACPKVRAAKTAAPHAAVGTGPATVKVCATRPKKAVDYKDDLPADDAHGEEEVEDDGDEGADKKRRRSAALTPDELIRARTAQLDKAAEQAAKAVEQAAKAGERSAKAASDVVQMKAIAALHQQTEATIAQKKEQQVALQEQHHALTNQLLELAEVQKARLAEMLKLRK